MTDIRKAVEHAYTVVRGATLANAGDVPPHWDDLSEAQRKALVDVCTIAVTFLRAKQGGDDD